MKRITMILLFVIMWFSLTTAAHAHTAAQVPAAKKAAPSATELNAKVEEYMQAQVKVNRFSGTVLLARDGKILFEKGYGWANAEWEIPNSPATKFRLGSITKQFTSMLVMQLVQQGRIGVQDPICKYLETCPDSWKPVTVFHLLTHTSGIPSYTGLPDYRAKSMTSTTPAQIVERFRDKPLEFAPGEKYVYNNSGYLLLGLIIEKASGKKYEELLREQVFEPLGMKDSGYDHSETVLRQRATGYSLSRGQLVNANYLDMQQPFSAGSLYSTVRDLLIWDQALYTERLLPKAALETMFTPFKGDYAFGWAVREAAPATFGRKQISHGGGINGFSTMIARYPEDRTTIIVLSNNEAAPAGRPARDLAAILFGESYEIPVERKVAKVDPKLYDDYVGQYELAPNFVLTVTREGNQLFTQATGQQKVEVFPESETKFFLKVIDAQITFVRGADGKVTHLILHQGGREQTAKRIQ
jgi:CubicO group peptidase (beta-lactamase class C family)